MKNTGCNVIIISEREKIFRGLEYDRLTKEIYTSCGTKLGIVIMGKIKWYKKIIGK